MNRIILIGNGFDLAHQMPTSYKNFINDYWNHTISKIRKISQGCTFENDEIKINSSPSRLIRENTYQNLTNALRDFQSPPLKFKNQFLQELTHKNFLNNWVDIENEYYFLLKKSFDKVRFPKNNYDVEELNMDFEIIKIKLGEYLKKVEEEFNNNLGSEYLRIKKIIGHKIYQPFKLKDFSESSLNQKAEIEFNLIKNDIESLNEGKISIDEIDENKRSLIQRIGKGNPLAEIKKLLQSNSAANYFDIIPEQTLFLNFNYTFTDKIYSNPIDFNQFNNRNTVKSIHIHGTTDDYDNNPIIFGFGDELDDEYRSIEKLNENKYLENIKSINYLETDNYKQLLEYLNSGNFQIFIFGHSCGTSDRTLLNTMFEHDNCASIKVFYHQKPDNIDNYSDIVRNISRNFNDKAKMRDRVVNKNYSEPLI